jgi:hypothetical protein
MIRWTSVGLTVLIACTALSAAAPAESAAQRGKKALLGKSFSPPTMALAAYESAWRHWGLENKPGAADYDRLFRERYGLHAAPYPNDNLPMGLRQGKLLLGGKGLSNDCLICHGGSIFGTSYVGLGNTSLDFQTFYEEMNASYPRRARPPFHFANVRGTNEAGGMAVFLLGFREPSLSLRLIRRDLDLQDDLCEDVPPWWHLKKKKTMYYTGGADTRSVRSIMQFMMSPLNLASAFHHAEADFKDIRAYLMTIEPPRYPLSIDAKLAGHGATVFSNHCSRCHGTYGEKWTYPNKIIPVDEIGTDRRRFDGISRRFGEYYNKSWFAEDYKALESDGYQAPPLDGIWASAPYLHNGSVPTVYNLLNSKTRPRIFTRSYRTDRDAYDSRKLGWKVDVLQQAPDPKKTPGNELRKVYDTTQSGRGNAGHTYGDKLSEDERMAVIEYLKTL